MSIPMRNLYEEPKSSNKRLVMDVVLLSLLAHALLITLLLLISVFMPMPKIKVPAPPQTTTLTLEQAPPQKPKQLFIPTPPQPDAVHKVQPVVSANDHDLTTKNQVARKPDSIMPDVTGKEHATDLNNSPQVTAPPKPEVSSTPPTPKEAKPEKPTPPQPNPSQGKQPSPQPPTKPQPPTPPAPKPQPQLVDENGFPVLPPLNAQTMAPPNSAAQPLAPAPSQREEAANSHGSIGKSGANSPAAMKTVLGLYKQRVYQAVGSHWYPQVDKAFQILGVGVVHIQFTIHADGTVETKVLDDGGNTMQTLLSISITSIRDAAPFDKFDAYPGLREEIIKEQGGDGSSYTDDFSFSIYGR